MGDTKIVIFPVTTFTRNRNISLGIPTLFPLTISGHVLSWKEKHILASSVDRPPNRDQDFMHKKGSSAEWASPEHASIILSSETYIYPQNNVERFLLVPPLLAELSAW